MTSSPLYSLTWGEYGTSLVSAVQHLRCHGELVDVTLAAGGRTFHAHKVVLCAASPFLLDLLKSTTCKHPVVMLAGVQASDLEALLEFVYRGEVSIDPNQLPSLLQAAHCLNIQGLAPMRSTGHVQQTNKNVVDDIPLQVSTQIESPTSQDEETPIKKKKRVKRLFKTASTPQLSKWSKIYIQQPETSDSITIGQDAQTWTQQINLSESTSTGDPLPLQQSLLIHSGTNSQTSSTGPKIRGASDQPGACPLCGLMLRQARNLRRHLITSCKYRMVNETQNTTNTITTNTDRNQENHLHQLQTISLQNLDNVTQTNMEHLETKPITLTPISCTELLPPSSNIISMTSNSMQ